MTAAGIKLNSHSDTYGKTQSNGLVGQCSKHQSD